MGSLCTSQETFLEHLLCSMHSLDSEKNSFPEVNSLHRDGRLNKQIQRLLTLPKDTQTYNKERGGHFREWLSGKMKRSQTGRGVGTWDKKGYAARQFTHRQLELKPSGPQLLLMGKVPSVD